MPKKLDRKIVFLAFITAFLSNSAFAGEKGRIPSMINVDGGLIEFGTDEMYVGSFSIAPEAVKDDQGSIDCEIPTAPEYLMAANLPDFKVGQAFESVRTPPDDACSWSREILEAEGIDGNVYFAGIGSHVPRELEFINGGTNPRDSISRIHSNVFSFWGNDYKPSPMATRCIQRSELNFPIAEVNKERVQVKSRRNQASKTKMTLDRGTRVTVIYTSNNWSFIKAEGPHICQTDPEWTKFEDVGWILTTDYE